MMLRPAYYPQPSPAFNKALDRLRIRLKSAIDAALTITWESRRKWPEMTPQPGHPEPYLVLPAAADALIADVAAHLEGAHPRPLGDVHCDFSDYPSPDRKRASLWQRVLRKALNALPVRAHWNYKTTDWIDTALACIAQKPDDYHDRYRLDTRNILVTRKGERHHLHQIDLRSAVASFIEWWQRERDVDVAHYWQQRATATGSA